MTFSEIKRRAIADAIISILTQYGPRRNGELVTLLIAYPRLTPDEDHDFRDVDETNIMPVLESMQERLFRYKAINGGIQGAPYSYRLRTAYDPNDSFHVIYQH